MRLAVSLLALCGSVLSGAAVPPAGTVISNTASSTQQVGAATQTATTNTVSATVFGPALARPALTKSFGAPSILSGGSTTLAFHLSNAAGAPAQAGIAFIDTLPSGLKLTTGATAAVSAGCSAVVTLTAPSTIGVSAGTMAAGVTACDITVNGVTNVSAANPDCSTNPPAFTNGASAIGGTVNVDNAVTNQCLVVNPFLNVIATPVCVNDTPYVDYAVTPMGVSAPSGVTITWEKVSGQTVTTLTGQPLTGRVLWPGTVLNGSGRPVLWPGWADMGGGNLVPVNDGLRPNIRMTFTVNPTMTIVVSYPPATPACTPDPVVGRPNLDMTLVKTISANAGVSPSGPYTVTLRYSNVSDQNGGKNNVSIVDDLPAGMVLVPGSLRILPMGGPAKALPDASGTFTLDGAPATYGAANNRVSIGFSRLEQGVWGWIQFDVGIAPGLKVDDVLSNIARYSYTDNQSGSVGPKPSNTAELRVSGTEGVKLRGVTIPVADPGSVVVFENLLTNIGSRADTFNITLTDPKYPAGTVFKVFKSDGVTPLSDSNGDGIPDTGAVSAGESYKIVVKAQLPNGASGGPYSIVKNAQSVSNSLVKAADSDVVTTIGTLCKVVLEPSNVGRVAPGGAIVYTHVLSNVGNCSESISFPAGFIGNGAANWAAQVFLDNAAAGGVSIVGVLDAEDVAVSTATTLTLAPGARAVVLVRVIAPVGAVNGAANTSTLRVNGGNSGVLTATDVTTVATDAIGDVSDIITGYIDAGFLRPTVWGFIGKPLYLRANAPSCNADRTVIERRTIVITGPNGEREEIVATETGPDTGMFVADAIGVRLPPVVPGDSLLEGRPYDTYQVELLGCGKKITTTITLIDPNGVVFDSRNNQPITGATVRLVTAAGGRCSATPASVSQLSNGQTVPAPNVVVTGQDGRFDFPLVSPGDYCVLVTPPNGYTWISAVPYTRLPPGRNVLATGPTSGASYGGAFRVGPETGPVIVDIPVDGGQMGGLFVQKTALRSIVEVGDVLDYTVAVKNNTGYALNQSDVSLIDTLPAGFTYVPGSARKDGKTLADPQGGAGAVLTFNLGRMQKDQQVQVTYRVRVGPGAIQGDGVNRVVASYRLGGAGTLYSESNIATARVQVTGGVFSDRGYIVGKVFADCDRDGVQNGGNGGAVRELGIPGIRLYLEDGTNVITDAEGKFSLYGLLARTHVLKIDRTTLPPGIAANDFALLSNRNLGKGDSRVIDLKNGELHKANFAINLCSEKVLAEIVARRRAASGLKSEVDGRLEQKLETDPNLRANSDLKALPAAGVVGTSAPTANIAAPASLGASVDAAAAAAAIASPVQAELPRFDTLAKPQSEGQTKPISQKPAREPEVLLEDLLPSQDNALGFIGLRNGDVLAYRQIAVRIKGTFGATFKLSVNGKDIAEDRIGKKAAMAEKQLQAWEYLGVNLQVGENVLVARQFDQFGNPRGESVITVKAPGALFRMIVDLPKGEKGMAVADGKTPAKVIVKLVDEKNIPVTSRTAVSLFSSAGRWTAEDLSSLEAGVQAFIEGGVGEFELLPPADPAEAIIRIVSGDVKEEVRLDFLPDLREMIAAGLVEGVLNLRRLDSRGLTPARAQDGFDQEITHLSRSWGDGKRDAAARTAMFLKGKIKGEYLLTLAYDSDKNTRERLFRDIQPDEFYPIYGDSSVRAFDAQSTGRFYVRVDNRKSYLLYGDFNTSQATDARKLSNYNRSLTGIKEHFENSRVSANVFASRDSTRQIIDEFAANGTSGPFTLSRAGGLVNSEKIEILTRDRNQPAMVVRAVPLTRFVDYEIESLTGRILLKAPVPSLDENLNPISIRITYEAEQGGDAFWVAGADAQVKITERLEVGASIVDDRNPVDKFRMAGVNAIAKLADKTFLIAEIAQTRRSTLEATASAMAGERQGNAGRIEFRHSGAGVEMEAYAGRADRDFDNPSSSLTSGRLEIGGKLAYRLDEKTRIKGEVLRTEELLSGSRRDGMLLTAERTLESGLRIEAGVRHARDSQAGQIPGATGVAPDEVTTIRGRVAGDIPGLKDAAAYLEAEVDVQDAARKLAAVGADYRLGASGRIYARHEFISSLTGPYGLNNQQRQNSTVFGVNTDYMKDGNVFSEYRVRDAISGGDAEAAIGLRNLWTLADGFKLQTGFERVHTLSGTGDGEATAMTFGLEYTANPRWKGSTRLELRNGRTSDSILSTVAGAAKLNRDWTFLGRNTYSLIRNKGQAAGENEQDRMQAGLAYRDTDADTWNALGRIEHRSEKDTTQPGVELKRTVEMISLHANWQPRRPFTFSGRYAAKWTTDRTNGLATRTNAQLLAGRGTWDVARRWDLSMNLSTMFGHGGQSKYYGAGIELGFMVMENLWVSGGYNFFGYRDDDLTGGEYTNKGAFVRLRYKFDEDLFSTTRQKTEKAALDAKVAGM